LIIAYAGASSLSSPLRNGREMTKRYSRVLPPCFAMSSPAALAVPPVCGKGSSVKVEMEGRSGFVRTGCDEIVDDDHGLTRLYAIRLHLEYILNRQINHTINTLTHPSHPNPTHLPILLLIHRLGAHPGQLPLLPHGDKRRAQPERHGRPDQEPARVEPDDDVDLGVAVGGGDVVGEVGEQGLEGERGAEDGEEVLEDYALEAGWVGVSRG
jgi:hypothetical protein